MNYRVPVVYEFDTSVLIGLLDPHDVWHCQAVALRSALESVGFIGIYFDCVLAETISTATRRLRERKRIAEIDRLLDRTITNFPPDLLPGSVSTHRCSTPKSLHLYGPHAGR